MLKTVGATVTLLALLVLGVSVLPASHDHGGLTGPWRFTVRFADSGRWSPVLFQLQQNGDVLTGTYNGRHGPLPITGSVTGTDIEFSFVIREETRVTYRGTIGDRTTMEGTCDYREVSGKGTWTAERANSVWDSF